MAAQRYASPMPHVLGSRLSSSRLLSLLLLPIPLLACGDSTAESAEDQFGIQTTGEEVVLSNATERPTFYFVVERQTAAVLDFATCVEGPRCKSVPPGTTARIPYRQITGYKPDRKEAIVYWWQSVLAPTGPHVDQVRQKVVEL
jgi:hypothetical protein